MMGNFLILIKKEFLSFIRYKRIKILFFSLLLLTLFSCTMYFSNSSILEKNSSSLIMNIYNVYIQFLPLILIPILSPSISGDREKKHLNFLLYNDYNLNVVFLSKVVFYNGLIILSVLVSAILMIFILFISNQINFIRIQLDYYFIVLLMFILIISLVINIEIFISSLFDKVLNSAITTIVVWLMLLIVNIIIPVTLGKGIWIPFTQNSLHTSIIWRILSLGEFSPAPFDKFHYIPEMKEIVFSLSIVLIENLLIIWLMFIKKGGKHEKYISK